MLNDVYVYDSGSGGTSLYETVLKVRDFNLQLGAQYGLDINLFIDIVAHHHLIVAAIISAKAVSDALGIIAALTRQELCAESAAVAVGSRHL
mgnify:CR=1 FL=1